MKPSTKGVLKMRRRSLYQRWLIFKCFQRRKSRWCEDKLLNKRVSQRSRRQRWTDTCTCYPLCALVHLQEGFGGSAILASSGPVSSVKEQVVREQAGKQESIAEKQKVNWSFVVLCVHISICRKTGRNRVWRIHIWGNLQVQSRLISSKSWLQYFLMTLVAMIRWTGGA